MEVTMITTRKPAKGQQRKSLVRVLLIEGYLSPGCTGRSNGEDGAVEEVTLIAKVGDIEIYTLEYEDRFIVFRVDSSGVNISYESQ
jgi:hypothetical protein